LEHSGVVKMYVAESDHRELEEIATAGLSQLSILTHHSAKNTS